MMAATSTAIPIPDPGPDTAVTPAPVPAAAGADQLLRGIGFRLLGIGLMATMSALIKLAQTRGANLAELLFFRQAAGLPLLLAFMAAGAGLGQVRTRRWGAHFIRALVGMMAMSATFAALLLLPLAEATVLQFTAPIFASLLGIWLLRERADWHRWAAVIVGFAGVIIIAGPGQCHLDPRGLAIGLLAATCTGFVVIQLRRIGSTETAMTTVFWFSVLPLPPLALLYLFHAQPHDALTWVLMIAVGVIGGLGQLGLTAAMRHAPVTVVVPMDYSAIVWATFFGWLLFDTLPAATTWLGAGVIVASGLYIVWRQYRQGRAPSRRPSRA